MIPTSTPTHEEWSRFDPSHDVYQYTTNPLKSIFAPKNVAVIGATEKEGSVGRTILWNLISSPFGGAVFPNAPACWGSRLIPPSKMYPIRSTWQLLSPRHPSSPALSPSAVKLA
jgi:hypothetical protein